MKTTAKAIRLFDQPIIVPDMDERLGTNINGPSLIKVPAWVERPLGSYYLYFAHHSGDFIRLAYSDDLAGPWTIYSPGVLPLSQTYFDDHIASPDVHVDHETQRIICYFHGKDRHSERQFTRVAVSDDGLDFVVQSEPVLEWYARVFEHQDHKYALSMPGLISRSQSFTSTFDPGPSLFSPKMRHSAVLKVDDILHVFYSDVGDAPERIYHAEVDLAGDWTEWSDGGLREELLRPERPYEGSELALEPSVRGAAETTVNQLRDPGVFAEGGRHFLIYSVAGEAGLAIAELFIDQVPAT